MNSSNGRINKVFQEVKNAPLEFDLKEVEAIIVGLPAVSADASNPNSGFGLSSLKGISLLLIPIAALVVAYMYWGGSEAEQVQPIEEQLQVVRSPQDSIPATHVVAPAQGQPELDSRAVEAPIAPIDQAIAPEPKEAVAPSPVLLDQELEVGQTSKDVIKPSIDALPAPSSGFSPAIPATPYPDLSDRQMRRLKKSLYSNLYTDGLIESEQDDVVMKLSGATIVVNDVRLSSGQFQKYLDLTKSAGYGDSRQIKFNPGVILVGDFVGDEFNGSGLGLLPPEVITTASLLELNKSAEQLERQAEQNSEFGGELRKLDSFARKVLEKSPVQQGKKRILSVDLSARKMKLLYEMVQDQLINDELIASRNDFVLLGLGQDVITLNGASIPEDKQYVYQGIFQSMNIKTGKNRELRLNSKVIAIGDFKANDFSGSIWMVTE